jgi:hypothetical protein
MTVISSLKTHFISVDPIMGPQASAMGAAGMVETTDSPLALYVGPKGIKPSNIQMATSPEHPCFFPPENVFKSSGMCILVIT